MPGMTGRTTPITPTTISATPALVRSTCCPPLPQRRQAFPGQELEACHALLSRRVSTEQAEHPAPGERVDDEASLPSQLKIFRTLPRKPLSSATT